MPAHDVRREMLRRLTRGELTVGGMAAPLRLSLEAASNHVRVLEWPGLALRTIVGRHHVCRLDPAPLASATA